MGISTEDALVQTPVLPNGLYNFAMIDIEATLSKKGSPMLVATWEVCEGPFIGFTKSKYYTLNVGTYKKGKKQGKKFAMGVSKIVTDAHSLGLASKLPKIWEEDANGNVDAAKARVIYHRLFSRVVAKGSIVDQEPDDTGKVYQELVLLSAARTEDSTDDQVGEESLA